MPRARDVASSLAETARQEDWDYSEFLAIVLSEEVASRETHGGQKRVKIDTHMRCRVPLWPVSPS